MHGQGGGGGGCGLQMVPRRRRLDGVWRRKCDGDSGKRMNIVVVTIIRIQVCVR